MQFDTENKVVQLCAEGMSAEFAGDLLQAKLLFLQAWEIATTDFEKFTASHYVARHRENGEETLRWNLLALSHANAIDDEGMKAHYPSLYLNVGKSYEDLGNHSEAIKNYQLADKNSCFLSTDAYGDMIRFGIKSALKRMHAVN
jgi:tetratricopeptide (TPR) repeat protein